MGTWGTAISSNEDMKTFIFGALIILVGLISCKKDNEPKPDDTIFYDTIKPLGYFPAFPGSFWIYDNNDTLKVVEYEKYVFNSAEYTLEPVYSTLILPKLILNGIYNRNDSFAYVREYSISKSSVSNYRDPVFKGLLSTVEGAEFRIGGAIQGHKITGKTIKVDTAVYIGPKKYENVIITIQFDYACISGTRGSVADCATLREYYAKDVGLIKREKRNHPLESDFVKDIELVKYEIKK
jgi:hypothetical protein